MPHHPHCKKFLPYVHSKCTLFQLKTVSCALATTELVKSLLLSCKLPLIYWLTTIKSLLSLLFCRWNCPTLSAFLHRRHVPALWQFSWPSSGPSLTGPCLPCAQSPRTGCSTQVGSHKRRIEGENHLISQHTWVIDKFLLMQPRIWLVFWAVSAVIDKFLLIQPRIWLVFWAVSAHCRLISIFHPLVSSSSPHGCSQSIHPLVCANTADSPETGVGPCTWPC